MYPLCADPRQRAGMRLTAILVALATLVGCSGCQSAGGTGEVRTALATTTRVADTGGAVAVRLCDQAEAQAVAESADLAEYQARVTEIRQVCDPIGETLDALRTAQLAAVAAITVVDRCREGGGECVAEVVAQADALSQVTSLGTRLRELVERAIAKLSPEVERPAVEVIGG